MSILRAGLYERVSTEEQALRGYSIDAQKDNLEEYCHKNGLKIVGHYSDEGISGAKPPLKRPALQRLLDDVQAGRIDIILFTKLDRWFRNVPEYFKVQEILERHRVEWKTIFEDYDTTTANGRLTITIMLSLAQNERDKGSERVNMVLEHKRRNKEACFGGDVAPLGYKKHKDENGIMRLVKDEETEQAVNDFWDMIIKYNNVYKAGKYVNQTYGMQRTAKQWRYLFNREIYTGVYYGVEDFCEPYIDRELWQKIHNNRPIKKAQNKIYLFTGLIKCPSCGKIMASRMSSRGQTVYKGYRCKYADMDLCHNKKYISELKTEKYLLNNLEAMLKNEITKTEAERSAPKPKPKTNIAKLKEELRKLNVVYMSGNMSDNEYIESSNQLKEVIAKAEKEAPSDDRDLTPLKKVLAMDVRNTYEKMGDEDRRRFWRTIIKEIVVEGNDVKSVIFL